MKVISIFGGTGFIGTELIKQLTKMPYKIRLFTRNKEKLNNLELNSQVKLIKLSPESNLTKDLQGTDIIINLVGILHESRSIKFSTVHEVFVNKVIKSAMKQKIKRVVHISALGVNKDSSSKYLYSKFKSESVIRNKFNDYEIYYLAYLFYHLIVLLDVYLSTPCKAFHKLALLLRHN